MPRQLSEAARAAAMIRKTLTAQGLAVKVRSSNFSMGDSVDVTITDQRPEVAELVRQYCARFQYGHFDGMTDCYEFSNRNWDLPQSKFVHVTNECSAEMHEAIYQWIRANWFGGEKLPPTFAEGRNFPLEDDLAATFVHRIFYGGWTDAFWRARYPRKDAS